MVHNEYCRNKSRLPIVSQHVTPSSVQFTCGFGLSMSLTSRNLRKPSDLENDCGNRYIKLDFLSARRVNRLVICKLIAFTFCFIYEVITAIFSNSIFLKKTTIILPHFDKTLVVNRAVFPAAWKSVELVASISMVIISLIALIVYIVRLIGPGRRKKELAWSTILLFVTTIQLIPNLSPIAYSYRNFHSIRILRIVETELKYAAFLLGTLFYTWVILHSYVLDSETLSVTFYMPKLTLLIVLQAIRVFSVHQMQVVPSTWLFGTLFFMLRDFSDLNLWLPRPCIMVAVITLVEAFVLGAIFRCALQAHRSSEYVKYLRRRHATVGYRLVIFQSLMFYLAQLIHVAFQTSQPNFNRLKWLQFGNAPSSNSGIRHTWFNFTNNSFQVGIDFVLFVFALSSAYIATPFEVPNLDYESSHEDVLKFASRAREPLSYNNCELYQLAQNDCNLRFPRTFMMETQASLFNFAWLAYESITAKHERVKNVMSDTLKYRQRFCFRIFTHIIGSRSDIAVLVIDADDRIILAFRGPNSFNTDSDSLLQNVLPNGHRGGTVCYVSLAASPEWRKACVSAELAKAYSSIGSRVLEAVDRLLTSRIRSVLLTGHSTGGALATLCSLDLLCSEPRLNANTVGVTTFGAPAFGNTVWRTIYNRNVPLHWTICVDVDAIAIQRVRRRVHVGVAAIFTSNGFLLLEPDLLETRQWSRKVALKEYHSRSSYLLAMQSFCRLHFPSYPSTFWAYPVSNLEVEKWELSTSANLSILRASSECEDAASEHLSITDPDGENCGSIAIDIEN